MKVVLFQNVLAVREGERSLLTKEMPALEHLGLIPKGTVLALPQFNFHIQTVTYFVQVDVIWYENHMEIDQEEAQELIDTYGWEWDADI